MSSSFSLLGLLQITAIVGLIGLFSSVIIAVFNMVKKKDSKKLRLPLIIGIISVILIAPIVFIILYIFFAYGTNPPHVPVENAIYLVGSLAKF